MTRLPRATALPVTALLLCTALAGCGGGGNGTVASTTSSAKDWTSALCKALTPLTAHGTELQSNLGSKAQEIATDPAGVRDEFAKALGQLADDFEAGLAAAKKAGAPDVTNGKEIQKEVLTGLEKAAKVMNDAQKAVEGSAPDAKAVSEALVTVGQSISTGFESFGDAFDKLDEDATLSKEGDTNPDCKTLNAS